MEENKWVSITTTLFAGQYCPPPINKLPAEQVGTTSSEKVWWECERGHRFLKSPLARDKESTKNNGCPDCFKEKAKANKKKKKKKK